MHDYPSVRYKAKRPSKASVAVGSRSVNPMPLLTFFILHDPPLFSSHPHSSMLMSSGVHSSSVALQSRKKPRKERKKKRERKSNFPSFFSHPGLLLCAVQLAVTLDPLTLTPDPWTCSHATPFCVHLAMATPWSPRLPR